MSSSKGNVKELVSRWESRHSIHFGAAKNLIPETRDTRRWNIDIIVADNSYSKTKIESHCWYHSGSYVVVVPRIFSSGGNNNKHLG